MGKTKTNPSRKSEFLEDADTKLGTTDKPTRTPSAPKLEAIDPVVSIYIYISGLVFTASLLPAGRRNFRCKGDFSRE